MKTNDIRRVIDATLDGLRLQPEQRREIIERATSEEPSTPPRVTLHPHKTTRQQKGDS